MKKINICLAMALIFSMCSEGKNTLKDAEKTSAENYETTNAKKNPKQKNAKESPKKQKNTKKSAKNTKNSKEAKQTEKDSAKLEDIKNEEPPNVPRESNTVLLAGDILLEEDLLDFIDEFGKEYPIKKLSPILEGHDIVFANLEMPIGKQGVPAENKPYVFMVNPHYAQPIKNLHLDIVSIANNHIMDYGNEGLDSTIDWLKDNKIRYTGAGNNLEDARKPAIINRKGIEFVFLAYNERPPESFYAKKDAPGTAYSDIKLIAEDIKKYKTRSNIVMVSMHWGIENTLYPQTYQVELARRIIDAGADCIIGHHPHWIQGVEVYKRKPIFYSLGNLLNGFYNRIEYNNFMAVLHYRGLKLRRIEILPISGKNTEMDFQPYLLTGEEADEHLNVIKKISNRFYTHFVIKNNKGYIYIFDETNNIETRGRGQNP